MWCGLDKKNHILCYLLVITMEEVTLVVDLHTNNDCLLTDVLNAFNDAFFRAEIWGFDIDKIKSDVLFDIMRIPDDCLSGVTALKSEFFLEEQDFNYQAYKQEKITETTENIFVARLSMPDGKFYIVFMEVIGNCELEARQQGYLNDGEPKHPQHQLDASF